MKRNLYGQRVFKIKTADDFFSDLTEEELNCFMRIDRRPPKQYKEHWIEEKTASILNGLLYETFCLADCSENAETYDKVILAREIAERILEYNGGCLSDEEWEYELKKRERNDRYTSRSRYFFPGIGTAAVLCLLGCLVSPLFTFPGNIGFAALCIWLFIVWYYKQYYYYYPKEFTKKFGKGGK